MSEPDPTHDVTPVPPADPIDDSATVPPHWSPPPSRVRSIVALIIGVALVVLILAVWQLPPFRGDGPGTDNAYVRGRVTTIAPESAGYVAEVLVRDYQHVRRGQLLVRIEDDTYRARLEQARAEVAARESDLVNNRQAQAAARAALSARQAALASALAQRDRAQADLHRADALVGDGSVSQRERDATLAAFRSAAAAAEQARADIRVSEQTVRTQEVAAGGLQARVRQGQSLVASALIDLQHTRVTAPSDGQVGPVDTHVGRFVANGTPLFTLIAPQRWIIAEYKEAQTRHIRLGQHASFTVDALGGDRFTGWVESIAPATGSEFAAIKPDNGTGNFVKVPQRIGVRVAIPANQPRVERLRPGMSVEMAIDTSARPRRVATR